MRANRNALYDCFPVSIWDDAADDEAQIRWVRELFEAMRPFSTGGVYANNLASEGSDRGSCLRRELRETGGFEVEVRSDEFFPPQSEHQAGRVGIKRKV